MAFVPELKALYLLLVLVLVVVATEKYRAMPFLVMVLATGLYGLAQGGDLSWTAKEFNTGFAQTIAATGLAVIAATMIAQLGQATGTIQGWICQVGPVRHTVVVLLLAILAGFGGTAIGAQAVLTPVLDHAGVLRRRLALSATAMVNAIHGSLPPSPLIVAALAILGGDFVWTIILGVPVALAQMACGLLLARRAPAIPQCGEPMPTTATTSVTARPLAVVGLLLAVLVLIGLILCQSLGQIPSEPLGGGNVREKLLGAGRPMVLLLLGLAIALGFMGGFNRHGLGEGGWLAQGARSGVGILLAVGAAGGFQMMLHNNGMADLLSERVLDLDPAWGLAVPFLTALVNRALQGSALTAAITAAGMMQPLLVPLGLASDPGRALTAVAIGAGIMALPHINDGYFWLAAHHARMRPAIALRWITGGALMQGLTGLAMVMLLAMLVG